MPYRKARRGRTRHCRDKLLFETRDEAVAAGHRAGKAPYYCESHKGWHLSSQGGARLWGLRSAFDMGAFD